MAKYNETKLFSNQEIEFTYEGDYYFWVGDYELKTWGESASHDDPGYSEYEIRILETEELVRHNEETRDWDDVYPTPSILVTIENQIEINL